MKKLLSIFLLLMFASTSAFAAAATVTQTPWGYKITGGTDATLVPQNTWVTATAYVAGQRVCQTGHLYKCLVAHTSGTFSTDLTAKKWVKIGEATIWLLSGQVNAATATNIDIFTALGLDGSTQTSAFCLAGSQPQASFAHPITFGTPYADLTVTLAAAGDIVYLNVYQDNFNQN